MVVTSVVSMVVQKVVLWVARTAESLAFGWVVQRVDSLDLVLVGHWECLWADPTAAMLVVLSADWLVLRLEAKSVVNLDFVWADRMADLKDSRMVDPSGDLKAVLLVDQRA